MNLVGKAATRWPRRHPVARCVAVVLGVSALAACVPAAAASGSAAVVPWRQAGPGWFVAEYSGASLPGAVHAIKSRTRFYLVSPAGRKFALYTAPDATSGPERELADWSGDRQRILVQIPDTGPHHDRIAVEQISLITGTVISHFTLPSDVLPLGYTRPHGDSLLAIGHGSLAGILRYSLTGHLQRALAPGATWGPAIGSPTGRLVIAGTTTGLDEISNAGTVTRRIRVPARVLACRPVRWWNTATVLASCFGRLPYATSRLWLFPVKGGSPTALTPASRPHGLFQGYSDAWQLPGGLYLQAANANQSVFITRQRDGTRHRVTVPGPAGQSDLILTARSGRLLVQSGYGTTGPGSVFWLNPATRTVRFVFRTPPGTYGVTGATAFAR